MNVIYADFTNKPSTLSVVMLNFVMLNVVMLSVRRSQLSLYVKAMPNFLDACVFVLRHCE